MKKHTWMVGLLLAALWFSPVNAQGDDTRPAQTQEDTLRNEQRTRFLQWREQWEAKLDAATTPEEFRRLRTQFLQEQQRMRHQFLMERRRRPGRPIDGPDANRIPEQFERRPLDGPDANRIPEQFERLRGDGPDANRIPEGLERPDGPGGPPGLERRDGPGGPGGGPEGRPRCRRRGGPDGGPNGFGPPPGRGQDGGPNGFGPPPGRGGPPRRGR